MDIVKSYLFWAQFFLYWCTEIVLNIVIITQNYVKGFPLYNIIEAIVTFHLFYMRKKTNIYKYARIFGMMSKS